MDGKDKKDKKKLTIDDSNIGVGMCLGVAMGMTIGMLTDHLVLGMCIGIALGPCIGMMFGGKKENGESDKKDESAATEENKEE